jgi:hypothetical protein
MDADNTTPYAVIDYAGIEFPIGDTQYWQWLQYKVDCANEGGDTDPDVMAYGYLSLIGYAVPDLPSPRDN